MASRFYIESSGAIPGGVTPTDDAGWEAVGDDFLRVPANLTPADTALAIKANSDSSTANQDVILVQAIAGPFPAQTYAAQTISWTFQLDEEATDANLFMTVGIRALAEDDLAVLGTLVAIRRDASELAVSLTTPMARTDSVTSTAVSPAESHYLVFEIGVGGTPTSAAVGHAGRVRIGTTAAGGDLPANDTDTTTNKRPWINFANTISQGTAHTAAASLAGAGSIAAAGRRGVRGVASVAGAASVAAAGKRGVKGASALNSVASVSASGLRGARAASSLGAVGSLAAAGTLTLGTANASLGAVASMSGAGSVGLSGAADLEAIASQTASGALGASAAASILGVALLSASGLRGALGAASLAAAAALAVEGDLTHGARANLGGVGSLAGAGHLTHGGRVSLGAVGSFVAAGRLGAGGRASLVAIATITAVSTHVVIVRVVSRQRPRVYLHNGATLQRIAQLTRVKDINRSFSLRDRVHTGSFTIGRSDPAYELTSEHYAHVIVIESTEYPYPWVGRIVQRSRAENGHAAKVVADTYEAILAERFLPPDFETQEGTEAALRHILGTLNGYNATGVGLGYVEGASAPVLTLSDASGIEAIDQLAELVDMEWWIGATVDRAGDLRLDLNMLHERGADMSDRVRLSGPGGNFEIADWRGTNRGNAYAQTVVGGQTSVLEAWSERERTRVRRGEDGGRQSDAVDEFIVQARRSIRFGHVLAGETAFDAPTQRREWRAVIEALKGAGATGPAAQRLLNRHRFPARGIIGRAYPDIETWPYLEVGNVIWLSHPEPFDDGYDGPATILDVQPLEHRRELEVILEVE